MAKITAAEVKSLREATGAGMMAVKRALEEADGDQDKAAEILRVKGETKVRERGAERTASNGLVAAAEGAMIQLSCETDFVAKSEQFQQLAADIVAHAAKTRTNDLAALLGEGLADGRSVQENIDSVAAVVGEKIELSRLIVLAGDDTQIASYMHRRSSDLPPQIGVLVEFEGEDLDAARGTAMHIAAMKPRFVSRDEVPADVVENERRVAEATARAEGKSEQAMPRIIEGRVTGLFKDVVLLEQDSVLESKKSVKAVLDDAGLTVRRFALFEVGAG
jgi:elongation factor Ts